MKSFKQWTVKAKLALLVGIFATGFAIFAWVALSTLSTLKVNGPYYQKIVAGKDIIADVLPPPEYVIESYLLSLRMADPANRAELPNLIARSHQLRDEYNERHDYWNSLTLVRDTPMVGHLLDDSYPPAIKFFDIRDNELIPAVQSGNYTRAQQLVRGALKTNYDQHRRGVDQVVKTATLYNKNIETEAADAVNERTLWLTLLGLGLIGPLGIGVGWILGRSISYTLNGTVGALSTTSAQMAATVEQHERTAINQSAAVHETTTTMDELDASFHQTAEMVKTAAETAQQAASAADNGLETVRQTLDGMRSLKVKVGAVAEQIANLSEQTGQIGTITRAVGDLANQTNMLALNAAVEAARAGEHGKGFGVVAAEIRKLADESKRSAERIGALVEEIKRSTDATVMATEAGSKTVDADIQLAEETAYAFNGIVQASNTASEAAQQTLLAVPQQVAAVKQVLVAMESLTRGAKETADGLGQTKESVQYLREATAQLQTLV
ncbi:frizzy aggregation protein FrzCD [Abditibacteriota bacterium]|nr:frizzy aggregation protein FrzCD [Abditibacteriota bacterium]